MNIKIVYDNQALAGFKSGWGFSCLVDQRVLFDTGEEPESIFANLSRLGTDSATIEAVVISHDHWDHTGGLWKLLHRRPGLPVYGCPGFSTGFKDKVALLGGHLIECADYTEITGSIAVSGEIQGEYKGASLAEQALLVRTAGGLTVITGCSHPGIIQMIETAQRQIPQEKIKVVLGGFHMKNMNQATIDSIVTSVQELGVELVGPTHCTGEMAKKRFAQRFGENYLDIRAGIEIIV